MQYKNKKEVFQSPYDQYKERNGESFEILEEINQTDKDHDQEVLPMYLIKFADREEIEAWPEEIFKECSWR